MQQLAEKAGYTDEDAVQASSFFLEQLEGARPNEATLSCRIAESKPRKVIVYVAYDFGLKSKGYEIEFGRGDVQKGERWAYFKSLTIIPAE